MGPIAILGGGIAGLAVADALGDDAVLFEAGPATGGLARSIRWNGFACDHGPHRLFTDDDVLFEELDRAVGLQKHRRRSDIRLAGMVLADPVNALELLAKLPRRKAVSVVASFLRRRDVGHGNLREIAQSRFGEELTDLFFEPYSAKLFGIDADQISARWADQKLRIGSVADVIKRSSRLTSNEFWYPASGGYGSFVRWLDSRSAPRINTSHRLVALDHTDLGYECVFETPTGTRSETFQELVSTLPMPVIGRMLGIESTLSYRSLDLHFIHVDKPQVTNRHWTYFADAPEVSKINRVSEPVNFSDDHPHNRTSVLVCESTTGLAATVDDVVAELSEAGFINPGEVLDAHQLTVPNAYPLFDLDSDRQLDRLRTELGQHEGLHLAGRTGAFQHLDLDEVIAESRAIAASVEQRDASIV